MIRLYVISVRKKDSGKAWIKGTGPTVHDANGQTLTAEELALAQVCFKLAKG